MQKNILTKLFGIGSASVISLCLNSFESSGGLMILGAVDKSLFEGSI